MGNDDSSPPLVDGLKTNCLYNQLLAKWNIYYDYYSSLKRKTYILEDVYCVYGYKMFEEASRRLFNRAVSVADNFLRQFAATFGREIVVLQLKGIFLIQRFAKIEKKGKQKKKSKEDPACVVNM